MSKAVVVYNQCGHKLLSYKLGYVAHHEEMQRRSLQNQFQEQCPKCGLWLYKDEQATSRHNINRIP